ncbi:MAG: ABC transporter ATP-binding protein [Alphaproteobacteria bacterium]
MSPTAESLIRLSHIAFAYPGKPVLHDVSLAVAAGEIYGLVGADGAGKSTLLRIGVGQLAADKGEARLLDRPADDPALRAALAYMPQGFGLYPDLSVRENLAFFADLHGLDRATTERKIRDLLARTGMQAFHARRAGQLSGGMMQKLALVCALISEPRAMFLDEPTTGIDPVSRRAFWQLLNGVRAEGVAILYATANLDEAERCDRVGLLEDGRISREGTPLQLARVEDGHEFSVSGPRLRQALPRLRQLAGVELVFPRGRSAALWLRGDVAPEELQQQICNIDPDLTVREILPNLHEAMLRELALREQRPGEANHG